MAVDPKVVQQARPGEVNWDGRNDVRDPYTGPFASTADAKIAQAVQSNTMSGDSLQELVRPWLPQVELFPPRFGYRTRVLGIRDMIDIDRRYDPGIDFSGTPSGYESTSRNSSGQEGM